MSDLSFSDGPLPPHVERHRCVCARCGLRLPARPEAPCGAYPCPRCGGPMVGDSGPQDGRRDPDHIGPRWI